MLKAVALLTRKPGPSREQLIAYYETRHAPLIRSLLPQIRDYRRNFVDPAGAVGEVPDFDVVTEFWFDDRASYEAFAARCAEPEVARLIAEDEEHVFDRTKTRMFVVEEHGRPLGPALPDGNAAMLRVLLDEREIRNRLARFTEMQDAKDFSAFAEIFAQDLVFDYGQGGDHHGIPALEQWMRNSLETCGGTLHLIGNIVVQVDGDRAFSRTPVHARHQRPGELGGPHFDTGGDYLDRWERRPEGWRIVRRDAKWRVIAGDPTIVGVDEVSLD